MPVVLRWRVFIYKACWVRIRCLNCKGRIWESFDQEIQPNYPRRIVKPKVHWKTDEALVHISWIIIILSVFEKELRWKYWGVSKQGKASHGINGQMQHHNSMDIVMKIQGYDNRAWQVVVHKLQELGDATSSFDYLRLNVPNHSNTASGITIKPLHIWSKLKSPSVLLWMKEYLKNTATHK